MLFINKKKKHFIVVCKLMIY